MAVDDILLLLLQKVIQICDILFCKFNIPVHIFISHCKFRHYGVRIVPCLDRLCFFVFVLEFVAFMTFLLLNFEVKGVKKKCARL